MTRYQLNLLKKADLKAKKAAKIMEEVRLLRKEVVRYGCDHSINSPYIWESDNGYGRQSKIEGRRCDICGFIDSWNRGNFRDSGYGN